MNLAELFLKFAVLQWPDVSSDVIERVIAGIDSNRER